MKVYLIDAGERVAATFAAGMLAVVGTTGQDLTDWAVWQGGALAGSLAVLKALAARYTGDKDKASLL